MRLFGFRSLRRRLSVSLLLVFLVGLAASAGMSVWETLRGDGVAESILEERLEPLVGLVPAGLLALLVVVATMRWMLDPIRTASREAAALQPGPPGRHVSTAGMPTEILPLIDAFNGALDRLGHAYTAEQRLTADAAHQLRTPLAVLSLRLQRARLTGREPDWDGLGHDVARLERTVHQLLELARRDGSVGAMSAGPVDLSRVVREASADILPLAEARARPLDIDARDGIMLSQGSAGDLRDLVRNLIENALLHGAGTVSVALVRAGPDVVLTVADEGSAPRDPERLFDRFCKGDANGAGSGLGLAIVRKIAEAHGGTAVITPTGRFEVRTVVPA